MSNNPLTDEQKKRLMEISKLSPEEQQKVLPDFLKTLNKEQVEFLQKQQSRCPFCSIAKKEIQSFTVYEDESVMAVLDINPANKGHVLLFPLEHTETLMDLKDVDHIFKIAKKINDAIVKGLGVKGTNIFIANGPVAGQITPHFMIHIIPREEGDGVNFIWDPKKISNEDMAETAGLIKSNIKEDVVEKIEEPSKQDVYKLIERVP